MDLLLSHLEIVKNKYQYSIYSHISICINNRWLVLNKYYIYTNVLPVYITTVVLNPQHKWQYFEQKWAAFPDWIELGREAVQKLWKNEDQCL